MHLMNFFLEIINNFNPNFSLWKLFLNLASYRQTEVKTCMVVAIFSFKHHQNDYLLLS